MTLRGDQGPGCDVLGCQALGWPEAGCPRQQSRPVPAHPWRLQGRCAPGPMTLWEGPLPPGSPPVGPAGRVWPSRAGRGPGPRPVKAQPTARLLLRLPGAPPQETGPPSAPGRTLGAGFSRDVGACMPRALGVPRHICSWPLGPTQTGTALSLPGFHHDSLRASEQSCGKYLPPFRSQVLVGPVVVGRPGRLWPMECE